MNTISFMSANYVARQLDYHMTRGWGQGEAATNNYFMPLETFPQRFEDLLKEIKSLGFSAIDLWLAHLNPRWATPQHIAAAQNLLKTYQLRVVALAGGMGNTTSEVEAVCQLAAALDVPILGGACPNLDKDRHGTVALFKKYHLRLAHENHPEKDPQEVLDRIGDGGEGTIGAAIDTGWFGTQGYDAAQAIRILGRHIFHVHLKDVRAAGAHDTCRFGEGVVPVRVCVEALRQLGYQGAISIEHEPDSFNPGDDVVASRQMLDGWLQ